MILEALAQGRHVLYTYSHPGCIRATDASSALREIEALRAKHGAGILDLNSAGMQYIDSYCSVEKVRDEILGRWKDIVTSSAEVRHRPVSAHTQNASNSAGLSRNAN